jgi:hypothetical protein
MAPPTVLANEERARDIFRRLFDERDLTDPSWYWADDLITDLKALEMTVHGPDGMADFFTGIFAAMPDFAMGRRSAGAPAAPSPARHGSGSSRPGPRSTSRAATSCASTPRAG